MAQAERVHAVPVDSVVREVYLLDESDTNLRDGITLGLGFGR